MARWEHKSVLLLGLLAALSFGLFACGDDDGSGNSGDFATGDAAELNVDRDEIVFERSPMNEPNIEELTLRNDGGNTLEIERIELHEKSGDEFDTKTEFHKGNDWNSVNEIPPGGTETIEIEYIPRNADGDEGTVSIIPVNDPDNNPLEVPLDTPDLHPELETTPEEVSFARVDPRDEAEEDIFDNDEGEGWAQRFVEVENTGFSPLEINDLYLSGSDNFYLSYLPEDVENPEDTSHEDDLDDYPTDRLEPGESFVVRIIFIPEDELPDEADLIFESNDESGTKTVPVVGNSGEACMRLADAVDFGVASTEGDRTSKSITIENCSRSSELEIQGIELTDDGGGVFALDEGSLPEGLPEEDAIIDPSDRANFTVEFSPEEETDYEGEVVVSSNDSVNREAPIELLGTGSDNKCPTAKATARVEDGDRSGEVINTIPLKTVVFDGSESNDEDGSIDEYEWTILSRPQGSTERLVPNNDIEDPELFLDIAGTYEIELKVYDDQGTVNCGEDAIVTIHAEPDDDVHIQLVWDTPSDPDQTDDFGTDLDLHYLHPNGRWNDDPWDIYWRNPGADWGSEGDSSDDPSLDIDDRNGAGPENVNHSGLENLRYRTGVYYYAANGFGASYATIRIYVRGELAREIENKYLPSTGTFWDVAYIEWPRGDVITIDRVSDGFP